MKTYIIQKISRALAEGIDSECKVVYVLAESRKILEKFPSDPTPFALKLYCHWALHVDLHHPATTLPFLARVDELVAIFLDEKAAARSPEMFREFVFLETFRNQFRQFLTAHHLPANLCDEDERWYRFLEYYAGVIEDGSVSCKAEARALKYIRGVTFTKGKPAIDSYVPFGFSWDIALHDGRTLSVELSASAPNGKEMIFHAAQLYARDTAVSGSQSSKQPIDRV